MAAYSRTDIITAIRDEINEPTARIFSDSVDENGLGGFVDMGAAVCSQITNCQEIEEDYDCSGAGGAYKFYITPTNEFFLVESVSYDDTSTKEKGLQKIRPQAWGGNIEESENAAPKYYFVFDNKIFIYPTITSTMVGNSHILRIRGYKRYNGFGGEGTENLPEGLQFVPFYYAISCVYARLGKHSLSALNMKRFINECNAWRYYVYGNVVRVDSHDLASIPTVTVTAQ